MTAFLTFDQTQAIAGLLDQSRETFAAVSQSDNAELVVSIDDRRWVVNRHGRCIREYVPRRERADMRDGALPPIAP